MKNKQSITLAFAVAVLALLVWQCKPNNGPKTEVAAANAVPLQTHKEAADTLRADTTMPLKPVPFEGVGSAAAKAFLAKQNLAPLFITDYPDNGFYGDNRYRIEFIITDMARSAGGDPALYTVKGKNRFKKTITPFEGTLRFTKVSMFSDPNLDSAAINDMEILQTYALAGEFDLKEDTTLATSGRMKGTFTMEFGAKKDGSNELWFFTDNTPSKGSGLRFDGNWTSYKNAGTVKPLIWSRDLFRFANDILKDFSIGERDVEINPEYRKLGWDNFWDGEEWWHEAKKETM